MDNGMALPEQQQMQRPPLPPMPVPIPSGPDDDFFKFRIDGSDILEDVKNQLSGKVYDPSQKDFVQKFDRWANDDGINKILHVIYACGINKNTFLGNLKKEEILFKCKMIKKKLALLLFKRYQDFDIAKETRDLLIITVVNTVHSALSRSEGGIEARQLSEAAQRMEVFQHENQEKEKGLSARFPFFGKR